MAALVKRMFLRLTFAVEMRLAPRVVMFWMVPPEPSVLACAGHA